MNRPMMPAILVLTLALGACGAEPPGKDGGAPRPLTLSAVAYTTNTLTGETLGQLVTAVDKTSDGALALEQVPALDPGAQDGSAEVIEMVRDGTAEVGVVAARTFDLEGSTSLQALNLPLVVQSPAQAATFLADPVAGRMLAGLAGTGVVGLALTYDQMRQPLGFAGPVLPDDLRGARVLARPSRATSVVLSAMGAIADPRNGDDAEEAIRSGQVVGAETSMDRPSWLQSGSNGRPSAITGNVQLSIKANVIIVNPKVWGGLSSDQRRALRTAASETRSWAAHQLVPLSTAARSFCDQHIGDVTVADPTQLAAWRRAVAPAVAAIAANDPVTAAALRRLRQIVRDSPATDRPSACTMAPSDQLPSVTAEGDQSVVTGEWRWLVSAEKFAAAGASAQDVGLNEGTWTITFAGDGSYTYVEPHGRSCSGAYAVAGERISMVEDASVGDCGGQWEVTFTRDGDRMTWIPTPEFEATYPALTGFFANPLVLIAEPPA
jgi:TRAP-type C4-dicarboxylate transport system substrate-binding protein